MTVTLTERPPTAGPVPVEIAARRPGDPDSIEFIGDLEQVVESEKCSCNAGDDNPY